MDLNDIREQFFIDNKRHISDKNFKKFTFNAEELTNIVNLEIGLKKLNKKIIESILTTPNHKWRVVYSAGNVENFSTFEEIVHCFNVKYRLKIFKNAFEKEMSYKTKKLELQLLDLNEIERMEEEFLEDQDKLINVKEKDEKIKRVLENLRKKRENQ